MKLRKRRCRPSWADSPLPVKHGLTSFCTALRLLNPAWFVLSVNAIEVRVTSKTRGEKYCRTSSTARHRALKKLCPYWLRAETPPRCSPGARTSSSRPASGARPKSALFVDIKHDPRADAVQLKYDARRRPFRRRRGPAATCIYNDETRSRRLYPALVEAIDRHRRHRHPGPRQSRRQPGCNAGPAGRL